MIVRLLQYVIVFMIAAVVSFFVTPVVARVARALEILDRPAKNKLHTTPTPRLGGLAIFIAYFLSLVITKNFDGTTAVIISGGILVLLLGVLDDIFRVPAVFKVVYICVMTFVLAKQGLVVSLFGGFFVFNLLFTIIWILGVTSALNAVDNMDGLAGGIGAIAAVTFFIIALRTSQWGWASVAIALAGSLFGFLRHNFPPCKIFMGDSGSLFLGFTLAAIGIEGIWSTNPIKASIIPILVLGVPIFDLSYIVIRRWIEGTAKGVIKAISFCAKDHLSHRLLSLGLHQRSSVLFIYLISVCVSIGAIVLQNAAAEDAVLLVAQFILIFVTVIILIGITKRMEA